jgi:hypothetical protein
VKTSPRSSRHSPTRRYPAGTTWLRPTRQKNHGSSPLRSARADRAGTARPWEAGYFQDDSSCITSPRKALRNVRGRPSVCGCVGLIDKLRDNGTSGDVHGRLSCSAGEPHRQVSTATACARPRRTERYRYPLSRAQSMTVLQTPCGLTTNRYAHIIRTRATSTDPWLMSGDAARQVEQPGRQWCRPVHLTKGEPT